MSAGMYSISQSITSKSARNRCIERLSKACLVVSHRQLRNLPLPSTLSYSRFPGRLQGQLCLMQASAEKLSQAESLKEQGRIITIHYHRKDGQYKDWGLHVWGDSKQETEWAAPLTPKSNGQKVTWEVELIPEKAKNNFNHWVGFQIHKGDEKETGGGIIEIEGHVNDLHFVSSSLEVFKQEPDLNDMPVGSLAKAAAHWVERQTIVWRVSAQGSTGQDRTFSMAYSKTAGLELSKNGLSGEDGLLELTVTSKDIPQAVKKRFPHLQGCTTLQLSKDANIQDLVRCQLALIAKESDGSILDITGIQLQGCLDDQYFYDGPLGLNPSDTDKDTLSINLWAPTAQSVELNVWDEPEGGNSTTMPLVAGSHGVWTCELGKREQWLWKYYQYKIRVYDVWTQKVQDFEVTDPYSRSLAADGQRTQIADLDASALKPEGWEKESPVANPNYQHFSDMSVYELHIRDFSIADPDVPPEHRGKYTAFAENGYGSRHLQELQKAGLTHIHLLPAYDYGSVPEKQEDQQVPQGDLEEFAADSEEQQARVLAVADRDGFNWGYDPVHYGVPEGSYASNPHGPARVLEFRQMVQALHRLGLRVVLDVVYNHTFHSGLDGVHSKYAVFDKVVPGYYHRRTETGDLCTSACCNNTAPEHLMFERLIVDDIVHWVKQYKVDGFRWDIMGHLMLRNMSKVVDALKQLTVDKDGVDGSKIQMYAEAWSFGEVAHNQRGRNASQANVGGLDIGSFNDRFRDSVLGGSPFATAQHQGWVTGLYTQPSAFSKAEMDDKEQKELVLEYGDLLKVSLAGLLRDYKLETWTGEVKSGKQMFYGPQIAAYCQQPWENVNYSSCHDGETLFDQIIEKTAAEVSLEEKLRIQTLTQALGALGQGIAFFHAGCEMLRSKSLDRDSYNSGDWYNKLDFTMQSNNFGIGLPVATKNKNYWHLKRPLLANQAMKPTPEQIRAAKERFLEFLRIRYTSPLFRLRRKEDVLQQQNFHNIGKDQEPGVVIMELSSSDVVDLQSGTKDDDFKRVLVVFNAKPVQYNGSWPADFVQLELHPLQQQSVDHRLKEVQLDSRERSFQIPGRTAAVLVERR